MTNRKRPQKRKIKRAKRVKRKKRPLKRKRPDQVVPLYDNFSNNKESQKKKGNAKLRKKKPALKQHLSKFGSNLAD